MPLVCTRCQIQFEGIARAGMPCSKCLTPIIDLNAEIAKRSEYYDPVLALLERLDWHRAPPVQKTLAPLAVW